MSKSGGATRTSGSTKQQRAPGGLSKAAQARIARHEYLRGAALANAAQSRASGDRAAANRFEYAAAQHTDAIEKERAKGATARGAPLTVTPEDQQRAVDHAREGARYWQNLADHETLYPENKAHQLQRASVAEEAAKRYEAGNFRPPAATHGRTNETPEARLDRLRGELYAREEWAVHARYALGYLNTKTLEESTNKPRMEALRTEIDKVEPIVRERAPKIEYARLAKSKPYESQKFNGPAPARAHYGAVTTVTLRKPEYPATLHEYQQQEFERTRYHNAYTATKPEPPKGPSLESKDLRSQANYEKAVAAQMKKYERLATVAHEAASHNTRTPQQQREDTARNTLRVRTLAGRVHDAEIDHQHSVFAVRAAEPGTKAYDAARARAKAVYAKQESLRAEMNAAQAEELARLNAAAGVGKTSTTRARAKKAS